MSGPANVRLVPTIHRGRRRCNLLEISQHLELTHRQALASQTSPFSSPIMPLVDSQRTTAGSPAEERPGAETEGFAAHRELPADLLSPPPGVPDPSLQSTCRVPLDTDISSTHVEDTALVRLSSPKKRAGDQSLDETATALNRYFAGLGSRPAEELAAPPSCPLAPHLPTVASAAFPIQSATPPELSEALR